MRPALTPLLLLATLSCTGIDIPTLDDDDGDGLSRESEEVGATIYVNTSGRPGALEAREVTSDPELLDTDGDGLDDGIERSLGTDPRREDTDGDGLSDHDEVVRWGTSPVAVDTDGDAVGADEGTAPLAALFDGAELDLQDDGSAGPEATSPLLFDTDGDGASDHTEVISTTRSPRIAETPRIVVRMAPDTTLDTTLQVLDGETVLEGETLEDEASDTNVVDTTISSLGTLETAAYTELAFGLTTEGAVGASAESIGADASVEVWGEVIVGASARAAATLGFDSEFRKERSRTSTTTVQRVQQNDWTLGDGAIAMALEVRNEGPIAFTFKDLRVSASTVSPGSGTTRIPLTDLRAVEGTASSLAPGASTLVLVRDTEVPASRMLELYDASALQLTPAGYDLVDADGIDFDFQLEQVAARTVSIEIDDGTGDIRRFQVATDIDRHEDGRPVRRTLAEVLAEVGVEASADDSGELLTYTFDGTPSRWYTGAPPDLTGLDSPGYTVTDGIPDARFVQAWHIFVARDQRAANTDVANLLDAELGVGDRVLITLGKDRDQDGILDVEERLHGSSDQDLDSDDDGLTDFWELREKVLVVTDTWTYEASASPADADTDGDGLDDLYEIELGLSPAHWDSDGDGFPDDQELEDPQLDPLRYDVISIPSITCVVDETTGALNIELDDGEGDFSGVALELDIQMDIERLAGDGCVPTTWQNARATLVSAFDPPVVAHWSSADFGYPAFVQTHGDRVYAETLLPLDPGLTWLSEGPLGTTTAEGDCSLAYDDLDITLTVDVADHGGHTASRTCTVYLPEGA